MRPRREARETFLAYWTGHGRRHFRLEEELLFPAYAGYGDPHDPRVLRALGEHVMIRHRADALAATPTAVTEDARSSSARSWQPTCASRSARCSPLIEHLMPSDELDAARPEARGRPS